MQCVLGALGVVQLSCTPSGAGSRAAVEGVSRAASLPGTAGVLASELTSVSWKEGSSSSPLQREGAEITDSSQDMGASALLPGVHVLCLQGEGHIEQHVTSNLTMPFTLSGLYSSSKGSSSGKDKSTNRCRGTWREIESNSTPNPTPLTQPLPPVGVALSVSVDVA